METQQEQNRLSPLREALVNAFNYNSLDAALREILGRHLENHTSARRFPLAVSQLVEDSRKQGWLASLVVAARLRNSGNKRLRQISRDIYVGFQHLIEPLAPLLLRCPKELLKPIEDLYQRSLSFNLFKQSSLLLFDNSASILDLALDLADCKAEKPLSEFVRSIALISPTELASDLNDWSDKYLPIDATKAGRPTKSRDGAQPRVLIQVKKNHITDNFIVKGWLINTGHDISFGMTSTKDTEKAIRELLDRLKAELSSIVARNEDIYFEFSLPRELLSLPLDEWLVAIKELGTMPLGTLHPVFVRSSDRTGNSKAYLNDFRESFNNSSTGLEFIEAFSPSPFRTPYVFTLAPNESDAKSLYIWAKGGVSCCLVSCHLGATARRPESDHISALIEAGVPALLWSRNKTGSESALVDRLRSLVNATTLGDLPRRVMKYREDSYTLSEPRHPITLFWDNPNHQVPDDFESLALKEAQDE